MTMLAKSFANVQAVAPGFDSTRVLSARLTLPAKRFNNRDAIVTFQRALAQRLSSLPTVTNTGAITLLPLSGLLSRVPFTVEGRAIERERVPLAQFRTVSPGYFEAARIPLKRGRTFSERDTERTRGGGGGERGAGEASGSTDSSRLALAFWWTITTGRRGRSKSSASSGTCGRWRWMESRRGICISPIRKSIRTTSAPRPRTCSGSCGRRAIR